MSAALPLMVSACEPPLPDAPVLTASEVRSLTLLCDVIIPATDTGGAVAAGTVDFIGRLFTGDTQAARVEFRAGLAALNVAISRRGSAGLTEALGAILRETTNPATNFLRHLRRSAMIGYYTSEVGGAQELVYAPVPGKFQPDVAVTAETRAFSNDTGALLDTGPAL